MKNSTLAYLTLLCFLGCAPIKKSNDRSVNIEASKKINQELHQENESILRQNEELNENLKSVENEITELKIKYEALNEKAQLEKEETMGMAVAVEQTEAYKNLERKHTLIQKSMAEISENNAKLNHKLSRIDSSNVAENELAKGYVVLHCPPAMTEGKDSYIEAIIGDEKIKRELNTRILQFVNDNRKANERKYTQADLESGTIDVTEYMKIEALSDTAEFDIIKLTNGEAVKKVDMERGTRWKWLVRPKMGTANDSLDILFNIYLINKEGEEQWLIDETFSFKIHVKKTYFDRLQEVIWEEPKWPITAIIIPFLTFFAGIWKEKLNRKNTDKA